MRESPSLRLQVLLGALLFAAYTAISGATSAQEYVSRTQTGPSLDEYLKQVGPDVKVSIDGHTDSVGTDAYNQSLSERRANAVREYLVKAGVPASQLSTHGYGESKPAYSNADAEGRAGNRRTELSRM